VTMASLVDRLLSAVATGCRVPTTSRKQG
jgi:hypothetical protein